MYVHIYYMHVASVTTSIYIYIHTYICFCPELCSRSSSKGFNTCEWHGCLWRATVPRTIPSSVSCCDLTAQIYEPLSSKILYVVPAGDGGVQPTLKVQPSSAAPGM